MRAPLFWSGLHHGLLQLARESQHGLWSQVIRLFVVLVIVK